MKFASVMAGGEALYGGVVEGGFIALSLEFLQWATPVGCDPCRWAGGTGRGGDRRGCGTCQFSYDIAIPNTPQILCVGVNFPDRNAEYKDGSTRPC